MSAVFEWLPGVAGLSAAILGGVFLCFSDFLMRSLARLDSPAGIAAMQSINRVIYRSLFMAIFLGLALLGVVLLIALRSDTGVSAWTIAGALVYLLGVFAITAVFNVPLNQRLDAFDPSSVEAGQFWKTVYLPRWVLWNSVRSAACVTSAGLFLKAWASGGGV